MFYTVDKIKKKSNWLQKEKRISMNQESNFLNQWFHLRYQEDLPEFDDGLSLSNLYALVGAGRLLGSVLLLAAVMLHRHCGVAWLYLLPSLLVGAGMIVLVERLWRVF